MPLTPDDLFLEGQGVALHVAGRFVEAGERLGLHEDDLQQSSLMALWQAAGCYKPTRMAFTTWAFWYCNSRLKRAIQAARRRRMLNGQRDAIDPADDHQALADRLDVEELLAAAGLSRGERAIVRRRFWRGESYDAIGQALGIGCTTVQNRERRAIEKLREACDA